MSDVNRPMLQGILGGLCKEGVFIDKVDKTQGITFYISIPAYSYAYHMEGSVRDTPEAFAKRIKESLSMMVGESIKVKFKTHDTYWTKDLGEECYYKNRDRILNLQFPVM